MNSMLGLAIVMSFIVFGAMLVLGYVVTLFSWIVDLLVITWSPLISRIWGGSLSVV